MDLKADDYVGVSFWIISAAMVAATVPHAAATATARPPARNCELCAAFRMPRSMPYPRRRPHVAHAPLRTRAPSPPVAPRHARGTARRAYRQWWQWRRGMRCGCCCRWRRLRDDASAGVTPRPSPSAFSTRGRRLRQPSPRSRPGVAPESARSRPGVAPESPGAAP